MDNKGPLISRRGLIESSVVALGSILLTPKDVMAVNVDGIVAHEIEGSSEARACWADAVNRAQSEGLPVFYGAEMGDQVSSTPVPFASVRTVTIQKRTLIDTYSTNLMISANYGTTAANNRISPFNWAKLYNSILTVKESNYNRAVLDSGKTSAIYYHAVFTLPSSGVGTFVGDFYAEFYYTFTGKIY